VPGPRGPRTVSHSGNWLVVGQYPPRFAAEQVEELWNEELWNTSLTGIVLDSLDATGDVARSAASWRSSVSTRCTPSPEGAWPASKFWACYRPISINPHSRR
jgi:hypothetical protein